jgi:hypothetical protein
MRMLRHSDFLKIVILFVNLQSKNRPLRGRRTPAICSGRRVAAGRVFRMINIATLKIT